MRFSHEFGYDASPAEVYAMLSDPAFREKVAEALPTIAHDISIEGASGDTHVEINLTQSSRGLPGFAKKVVGDQIHVRQVESWNDEANADLEVTIPGKPGRLKGGIALVEDGDGTVEKVTGDLVVKVPLVAGKLEKLISDMLVDALETEAKVGREWLAG
jgi:carbon monoxide dehydrogenase subunit G